MDLHKSTSALIGVNTVYYTTTLGRALSYAHLHKLQLTLLGHALGEFP